MKKRLLALLLALSLAAPGFGTTPAAFAAQRGAELPPDAKSTTAPVSYTHLTLPTICSV